MAQHLFPEITSEKEKIDIFEFNKEAFNLYDTERAIRANSNVISPQGFKKHTTKIGIYDIAHFDCVGTPEQLQEYLKGGNCARI